MSFTTQFALFINGHIYCEDKSPPMFGQFYHNPDMQPVIFDTKADALMRAERIRDALTRQFHIDPIITVAHRWCSEWNVTDPAAEVVTEARNILEGNNDGC